ncbi:efflux RND transporter periplasmic adaptor subunit [Tautonia plasticadhaerens]|uniref:Inner membrane protein YiaV n=1 Tax=Tautonia plasticadhaerens TaxID=2527974 RepID=A0A518H3I5_9BACT|nr:HlyD family efflux transporter periplasmic adaptor subunit [Tautonia plasticadhaerens]QDV35404.1 Inner membrane protein YiaV precursor [Tautonia plasticadhaerens]
MPFEPPLRPFLLAMPVVAISGLAGLYQAGGLPWGRDPGPGGPPVARVMRLDPQSRFAVTVPGQVKSARYTLIECEVENISGAGLSTGGRGSRSRSPSGLTLISLVPEGSYVNAGEILAEIDPSRFDEIARLLQISVEEARAEEAKAGLDLQAAEIALAEYLDGVRPQTLMQLEGQVALAKSQLQQQQDHLDWTNRVLPLGYVAISAVQDELITMLQSRLALDRAERSVRDYVRYTQPKLTRQLESRLDQARASHRFALRRLELDEERLALAESQLERCTIRAPHDGRVVYCTTRDGSPIRVGLEVYRRMDLFLLPDLDRPVVEAQVNQTQIWRVAEGMEARVRVDAKPGLVLRGRVTQVSPFADTEDTMARATGVMRYNVGIELEPGERLLPGLSAEVAILIPAERNAMAIPSEALAVEGGETVCFVVGPAGVERRVVDARPGSIDRLQVVDGLSEGEEVLLGPPGPAPEPETTAPDRPESVVETA